MIKCVDCAFCEQREKLTYYCTEYDLEIDCEGERCGWFVPSDDLIEDYAGDNV